MRATLGLALLLYVVAPPLSAQTGNGGVQLELLLPAQPAAIVEGPSILTANLLSDSKTRELLRNGFPTQIHYRVELWRKTGLFDDPTGSTEWDVLVSYDPTSQLYKVARKHGDDYENFGGYATVTSAEAVIDKAYHIALKPPRSGKYYYSLTIDLQTLSLGDLEALEGWLRGEARPAVRGQGNPLTAIRNGIGTLLSRLLGGDKRQYRRQSETFTVE